MDFGWCCDLIEILKCDIKVEKVCVMRSLHMLIENLNSDRIKGSVTYLT